MHTTAPIHIAINGFGRIGRAAVRALIHYEKHRAPDARPMRLCAINDLIDAPYMQYLLTHDSVHRCDFDVQAPDAHTLIIDGQHVQVSNAADPLHAPWSAYPNLIVLESTGIFTTLTSCQAHLHAGARSVLISAPSDDAPMFVMGVNHTQMSAQDTIISAASCTTNCLAPLLKAVDAFVGVDGALMCTVHAATASQKVVDGLAKKDWRSGRSVFDNIIPSSTGAAKAVGKVLPHLQGRINGNSYRVPTSCGSLVDVTVMTQKPTSKQALDAYLRDQSATDLAGILDTSTSALVSCDIKGRTHTSIYDVSASMQLHQQCFKLVSWYDNETGYAHKCVDLMRTLSAVHHL